MFSQAGLPTRETRDDASRTNASTSSAAQRPVDYVVRKDGKPFAILNATPALAQRTVTGFALASPGASWSFDRL